MLALDWNEPDQFLSSLQNHLAQTEPPDLVIAWIHDDELAIRSAASFPATNPTCRFFHVIGSATLDPSSTAASFRQRLSRSNIAYRQVILGYIVENGAARWLTDEEISCGVLDAIAQSAPEFVVGTIRPWESRP
ncbi:MAG: short-chain dehydrogenase [Pseudomonadota bacterium]|nr:short-chain dehydrogenase [Pseudomonadota bacterium]